MPKARQTSVMAPPSSRRATKRRRSSITELAFHGINTSRPQKAKSVTHVSGTECHPCLGPLNHNYLIQHIFSSEAMRLPKPLPKQTALVRYSRLSAFIPKSRRVAIAVRTNGIERTLPEIRLL